MVFLNDLKPSYPRCYPQLILLKTAIEPGMLDQFLAVQQFRRLDRATRNKLPDWTKPNAVLSAASGTLDI